jgi:hypothetical protein
MAYKGKYKAINPKKYAGNVDNIVFRSRWEFKFMRYLDKHPNVIQWASEELWIYYWDPVSKRKRRYYPDFLVKKKTKDGTIKTTMVEIKPFKETLPPKQNKNKKRFITETLTYNKNQAKWRRAREWCKDRNIKFVVMTENELGLVNGR